MLATLVRTTGSWTLAEDAVQDAVVRALKTWPRDGVPPQPRAWLTVTARRCAIDMIRRESVRGGKETAAMLGRVVSAPLDDGVPRDDLLRLLFTCCHPALPVQAQTALALHTLCGFTPAETARALLVSEPAMVKRLTRARRKIADAGIPYRVPSSMELPARLRGVLATVYLLFTEGYHAGSGDGPLRTGLTGDAIRLAALTRELLPGHVPVLGLEALLRLHDARRAARVDAAGLPVTLADQDRTRWDRRQIARALALLGQALRLAGPHPDPYVVQAAIAACHDLAPTWQDTDWPAIISWYDVLLRIQPTPVVRLAHAVAVGELRGAAVALCEVDHIDGLHDHVSYAAGRAELLARAGRLSEARQAYGASLTLTMNDATRRLIRARQDELT